MEVALSLGEVTEAGSIGFPVTNTEGRILHCTILLLAALCRSEVAPHCTLLVCDALDYALVYTSFDIMVTMQNILITF